MKAPWRICWQAWVIGLVIPLGIYLGALPIL